MDSGNTSATAGVQKDVAPNFTQDLLQRCRYACYWWAKLHADTLRESDAYANRDTIVLTDVAK